MAATAGTGSGGQVGFTIASELLLPVTLLFAAAAVLAAFIRLVNLRLNGRLAAAVGSDLSYEAYRRTLYQPLSGTCAAKQRSGNHGHYHPDQSHCDGSDLSAAPDYFCCGGCRPARGFVGD